MTDDDFGLEIFQDISRSTVTLSDEAAERVEQAREALLTVLGMMTCHVPEEPTEDDIVGLTRLAASALRFRNVIRSCFYEGDLPEGYNAEQGQYVEPETVH